MIPNSGWRLSAEYREFDAEQRFQISGIHTEESPLCHAGDVLRGPSSRPSVRRLAKSARRAIRWEQRWFQAKARARRITIRAIFVG